MQLLSTAVNWVYLETTRKNALLTALLVRAVFCVVVMLANFVLGLNQSWFMGAFLLSSDYVTAKSLNSSVSTAHIARRTRRRAIQSFLRGRALRLVIPALVYTFFAGPLPRALATSQPLIWEFLKTYLLLIRGMQGPAWFMTQLSCSTRP